MEKFLSQLGHHFGKVFVKGGDVFAGIREFIMFIVLTILAFNNLQLMLFILVLFWIVDTITAIWAQRRKYKNTETSPEVYTMESNKLRDAGIKLVAYGCIIIVSTIIVRLFYGGSITLVGTSESVSGAELAVALCLFIEFWSILENAKKLGFDVVGKVQNSIKKSWKIYRGIKGE